MRQFERAIDFLCAKMVQAGEIATVFVAFMLVANILTRVLWKFPLPGTVELTEIAGAVLLAGGVAYCQRVKGHVSVEVFVEKLPLRAQAILSALVTFIAILATVSLARGTFSYASRMAQSKYMTADLHIPVYPVIYFVAACFALLTIVLCLDFINAIKKSAKGGSK